jgi:hypothetical protein
MRIEESVKAVLNEGFRTADISHKGQKAVSTQEMGHKVVDAVRQLPGAKRETA